MYEIILKILLILLYFWPHTETKYRNLAILTNFFGPHFWLLKISELTSFMSFEFHFMAKLHQINKRLYLSA
jgi:hypothetical protein